jgi:AcrR family transcriptional regulator
MPRAAKHKKCRAAVIFDERAGSSCCSLGRSQYVSVCSGSSAIDGPTCQPAIDQKERLLAATERLLCSRGLACVTTRDIAHAARVAEGALYNHFGDKAELILEVVLHGVGEFREVLDSLPLQVGQNTVQKNLERVLESAFHFHHRIAALVCSLFADQELLARVRGTMNERCIGPGRTASVLAACECRAAAWPGSRACRARGRRATSAGGELQQGGARPFLRSVRRGTGTPPFAGLGPRAARRTRP